MYLSPYDVILVTCPISQFYARAYVHSTEDLEKVVKALRTVVNGPLVSRTTKGHHGNTIQVLEVKLSDCDALDALRALVSRLDDVEFQLLLSGVEGVRLYAKFDKQQAFAGRLRISHGDDVIFIEIRARSLEVADFREFLKKFRNA